MKHFRNITINFIILTLLVIISGVFFLFSSTTKLEKIPRLNCVSYIPTNQPEKIKSDKDFIITPKNVRKDLELLLTKTSCVRFYTAAKEFYPAYEIANEIGFEIIAGANVGVDRQKNITELKNLIELSKLYPKSIKLLVAGNEVQYRKFVTPEEQKEYIIYLQKNSKIPVTIAEIYGDIFENLDLTSTLSIVGYHEFPFWNGTDVTKAVESQILKHKIISIFFAGRDKKVYLLEAGWPTDGYNVGEAKASLENQRLFISELTTSFNEENYFYNIIEAFDQPWKRHDLEGREGMYWGLLRGDRGEKDFNFQKQSILISVLIFLISIAIPTWIKRKDTLFIGIFYILNIPILISIFFITQSLFIHYYFLNTLSLLSIKGLLLLIININVQYIIYTTTSVLLQRKRKDIEKYLITQDALPNTGPLISIHIPAKNEDPQKLIKTIENVLNQNYSNFEIVVVINNTVDTNLVEPVRQFCKKHSPIKFIYEQKLSGFKSGALNLALANTDKNAEYIGIIDADYNIEPNCLPRVAKEFENDFDVVQFPQAYKNDLTNENILARTCTAEQDIFKEFLIERLSSNSFIMQGTMLFIRKKTLLEVGGWDESTIVEDCMLGIQLINSGKKIHYIPIAHGFGEAPSNWQAVITQRSRWVSGTVSGIFRKINFKKMNPVQIYHYLMSWSSWLLSIFYLPFFFVVMYRSLMGEISPDYYLGHEFFLPIFLLFLTYTFSGILIYTYKGKGILNLLRMLVVQIGLIPSIGVAALKGVLPKALVLPIFTTTRTVKTIRERIMLDFLCLLFFYAQIIIIYIRHGMQGVDQITWVLFIFFGMSLPFICRIYLRLKTEY